MYCLNELEKNEYLNRINTFYKYDKSMLESTARKNICKIDVAQITSFDKETVAKLASLLVRTRDFLDKLNITYWISEGSLLGAIRDNKFIPWDDDIDLAVPYDDFIKLRNLILTYKHTNTKNTKNTKNATNTKTGHKR